MIVSMHSSFERGFTLIEILVVVTIISIMAGTVAFFSSRSSAIGRDADRQADLRALQAAVEAYRRDNGVYPEGCRGAGNWSGEQGTAFACTSGDPNRYIRDIAPQYIRTLPRDPNRNACVDTTAPLDCGYAYITNTSRDVYKIIAMNTVESMDVTPEHPLASCDIANISSADIRRDAGGDGWCGSIVSGVTVTQTENTAGHQCNISSTRFLRSFAVWGGIVPITASVCDGAGRCLDPAPNPTVDPLENFRLNTYTDGVKRNLRAMAITGTVAIICQ